MKIEEKFYEAIGYPREWLEDAKKYSPKDSYVIFDPSWEDPTGEIPCISIYELFKRGLQTNFQMRPR